MGSGTTSTQLAQQLEAATNELRHLEDLLLEAPDLLEAKFRRELDQLRHELMVLQAERQSLLLQAAAFRTAHPWGGLRLVWPQRRALAVALSCALGLLLVGFGLHLAQRRSAGRPAAPTAARVAMNADPRIRAGDATSILELEARDSSWIEVTDSDGQLLLRDTLEAGLTRRVRLRQGLRLFTARPEHLRYRIDGGPFQPLPAGASGRWIVITPRPAQSP
jgi:hypothetical protein